MASDRPQFKDCMKLFLENSAGFAFEKYDGTLALARVDKDGATTVGTISDSDILLKSNRPALKLSYTDIDKTITGIVIKYKKVLPEDNYYASTCFCYRINSTESVKHNFTLIDDIGNWQAYSGLLQTAYDSRGTDNILTFEADGIRDAGTAERLARALILQRWKPMVKLDIDCAYTALKYEIGDQVDTDIAIIDGHNLNGKIYMVTMTKIIPHVSSAPSVSLRLLEIGTASIPEATEWQDTYATGEIKQNTTNTGTTTIGVY